MEKIVENYKKWNNAFINYFFGNTDESEHEVFLYVNQDIIDAIGAENGLGTYEDFLNCVLISYDGDCIYANNRRGINRTSFYHRLLGNQWRNWTPEYNRLANNPSILTSAASLLRHGNEVLYFNFIILLLYIISLENINGENDRVIGGKIRDFLRERMNDNGKYDALAQLFAHLNQIYPSFKNYNFTNLRYVGLLKYQLILSNTQVNAIQRAQYLNHLIYDDMFMSYDDFAPTLRNYVDEDIKLLIDFSLRDANNTCRKRIIAVLNNFDEDRFERQQEDPVQRRHVGEFAQALFLGGECAKLVLLTDIHDTSFESDGYCVTHADYDSIGKYNPNHVKFNGNDAITIDEYKLNNEQYRIRGLSSNDLVFFQKCCEGYFVETKKVTDILTYVAVRNNRQGQQQWQNLNSNGFVRDYHEFDLQIVAPIIGEGWRLFEVSGFNVVERKTRAIVADRSIKIKGGIIPNNMNNVYLINALPYFEFPAKINITDLNIFIKVDNELIQENLGFSKYIVEGNKLIIDLTLDDNFEHSKSFDITIEYENESIHESFYVCGQRPTYDRDALYSYDGWGNMAIDTDHQRLEGQCLQGVEMQEVRGFTALLPTHNFSENTYNRLYFINLLSAVCYNRRDNIITKDILKKCISYAATRAGIDYMSEKDFVSSLRNLLVNSGFLAPNYTGGLSKFQAVPPAFVSLPPRFLIGGRSQRLWMLCGCFTRLFINQLVNYCNSNGITILVKDDNVGNASSAYVLIPPTIILPQEFNPQEFIDTCNIQCEVVAGDFPLTIMQMMPSVNDFQQFLEVENREMGHLEETQENRFPRIRNNGAELWRRQYWIEEENHTFYRINDKISDTNWAYIYCINNRYQQLLHSSGNGDLCIPSSVYLPFMLQRAMYLMNAGVPRLTKVFLCHDRISTNMLYTKSKLYNIGTDQNRLRQFSRIITNSDHYDNNDKFAPICNNAQITLELWTRKDSLLSRIPKYVLVQKFQGRIEAIATSNNYSVYIKTAEFESLTRIEGDINDLFSQRIADGRYWHQIARDRYDDSNTISLPLQNNYNIEEISFK